MPGRGLPCSSPPFSTEAKVTLSAPTSASSIETSRCAPRPVRLVALLERHHARGRVDDVGEGRALAPGPGLPEARDRAVHNVAFNSVDRRIVEAEPADHPGREVLDEHVGVTGQGQHHLAALGPAQVDRHALLAGVDAREVGRLVLAPGLDLVRVAPHLVALDGALDLDHAGAQVREQARAVGTGQHSGEVDDHETVQRTRLVRGRRGGIRGRSRGRRRHSGTLLIRYIAPSRRLGGPQSPNQRL